ncbi:hypothetical protein EWM64_g2165 [Hericium alpestre]|uniref:Mid2 domain-containing protein n=1 Tax=Hericium alpestre TaxID=135208 RepID=A0A4Z0A539_9AGAM|nr:hypothetical protein EWM64_g2165 [Hericium alpestre]
MFITKPSKLGLTLILYFALAVALVATVEAKGFAAVPLHRRDHVDINRMIKKRAGPLSNLAADLFPPSNGVAADPPSDSNTNTGGNTANAGGDSNGNGGNAGGNPSNSASASASNNTPSKSASASPSSSATPTSQSQSSSAAAASPTSSAASSSASSSSASLLVLHTGGHNISTTDLRVPEPAAGPQRQSRQPGPSVQSITVTSSIPSPSQTAASDKADTPQSSSKLPHTALIIIIVVASCVGGIAIIWTGIRKWKFRPSKDFEDRMQPIDWQPTDHDSGLPTHRRVPSNASSFHSSGHDSTGAKGVGGYGATSESALNPIPDHDFTAGASLAPVGGYADLARGPSPGPYARDPSPGPYGGPALGLTAGQVLARRCRRHSLVVRA